MVAECSRYTQFPQKNQSHNSKNQDKHKNTNKEMLIMVKFLKLQSYKYANFPTFT